jgi:serine/threonine-protein kinase
LPVSQALRYAIEIAGALDYAHCAHVVHRDVKPGNVMLTATGAKGTLTPRESEYRKTRTDDRVSRE